MTRALKTCSPLWRTALAATALMAGLAGGAQAALTTSLSGTYEFTGTCTDCPDPQDASAALTVGPGGVTFNYSSSLYTLASVWVEVFNLDPSTLPGPANASVLFGADVDGDVHTFQFTSDTNGNWSLDDIFVATTAHEDVGVNGNWAAPSTQGVPEPASAMLVGLALWAASTRGRRKV